MKIEKVKDELHSIYIKNPKYVMERITDIIGKRGNEYMSAKMMISKLSQTQQEELLKEFKALM